MLHFETGLYGEEPFFWRDPSDIREKLQAVTSNIDRARREVAALLAIREELIGAVGEEAYEEDSVAYRLLSELENEIEEALAALTAMKEELSDFKEELADTLYLMRGRGYA